MADARGYGYRVSYLARLVRTSFDGRARELGLTRAQWQTVATIQHLKDATQRRVAEALDVSPVTISRIVDRLEQDGWVEKRSDKTDRRASLLHLKGGARPILAKLDAIAVDEEEQTLAGISDAERILLSELLDRMIGNIERRLAPPEIEQ